LCATAQLNFSENLQLRNHNHNSTSNTKYQITKSPSKIKTTKTMQDPVLIFFALATFVVLGLTNVVWASTKLGGKDLAWGAINQWIFPKAKVGGGPASRRTGGHGRVVGGGVWSTLAVALLVGLVWGTVEMKKNIETVLPVAEAQSAAPFVAPPLSQPSILKATPPPSENKPMDRGKNMETTHVVGNKKAVVQYDQRDLPFLGHHAALFLALLRDFQERLLLRSMGQNKNNSCIGILGRKMEKKKARQRYQNDNQGTV
jgi:hypothetical protein